MLHLLFYFHESLSYHLVDLSQHICRLKSAHLPT